jgi:hypothetical protein
VLGLMPERLAIQRKRLVIPAYVPIHQHTSAYAMPERLAIQRKRLGLPLPVLVVLGKLGADVRSHLCRSAVSVCTFVLVK